MPIALKSILRCSVIKKKLRSVVKANKTLVLVAFFCALIQPSFVFCESIPSQTEIAFLPNEALSLDWQRDLGHPRAQLTACTNSNPAAEWLEVCNRLLLTRESDSFVIEELSQQDGGPDKSGARNSYPRVHLSFGTTSKDVRFVPMRSVTFMMGKKVEKIRATFERDFRRNQLHCTLSDPEMNAHIVRKTWILTPSSNPNDLSHTILEQESLPFGYLKSFNKIECALVVFDGTLFKRFSTSQPVGEAEAFAQQYLRNFEINTSQLESFNLADWVGPLKAGEKYRCSQPQQSIVTPSFCSLFDLATGTPKNSEVIASFDTLTSIVGEFFASITLTRATEEKDLETLRLRLLIHSQRQAPSNIPTVSLRAENFEENAECRTAAQVGYNLTPIRWYLNGKVVMGWRPWRLSSLLWDSSNSYACEHEGQRSTELRVSLKDLSILAPSSVILAEESMTIPVELNRSIEFTPVHWTCTVNQPNLACEIIGKDSNGKHILVLKRLTGQLAEGASVTLKTEFPASTAISGIETSIQILTPSRETSTTTNISDLMDLSLPSAKTLSCRVKLDALSTHTADIRWFVNGVVQTRLQGLQRVYLPTIQADDLVTCLATQTKNGREFAGISSMVIEPPSPDMSAFPSKLVIDLAKPSNITLSLDDSSRRLSSVDCAIAESKTGNQISENICYLLDNSSSVENRKILVQIGSSEIARISTALMGSPLVDPYFVTDYELRIRSFVGHHTYTKSIPVQLIRPNSRPTIHLVRHFFEAPNAAVCNFLVSDQDNNHLTAKVIWPSLGKDAFFSTFKRAGMHTLNRINSSRSTPHFLEGRAKVILPERFAQKVELRNLDLSCRVIVSDGTLISYATSQRDENSSSFQHAEENIVRDTATTPPLPNLQVSPPAPLHPEHFYESPKAIFEMDTLVLSSAGKREIPNSDGIETYLGCAGNRATCEHIYVSSKKLWISTTTDLSPSIVTLTYRVGRHYFFHVVSIHNEIFVSSRIDKLYDCPSLILARLENRLPSWLDLFLAARYEDKQTELPISVTAVSKALATGASDIICYLKQTPPQRARPVVFHTYSFKEALQRKENYISAPEIQVDVERPSGRILSLANLLPLISIGSGTLSAAVAHNVSIFRCSIANSDTTEHPCHFDPQSLSLIVDNSNTRFVYLTLRYQILGLQKEQNFKISIADRLAERRNQLLSARLVSGDKAGSYECQLTGGPIDTPVHFTIFENGEKIFSQTTAEKILPFVVSDDLKNKILVCDAQTADTWESAVYWDSQTATQMSFRCFGVEKTGVMTEFQCEIPSELIFAKNVDAASWQESLQIPSSKNFDSVKIAIRSNEDPLKESVTLDLNHENKTEFSPISIAPQPAAILDPFQGSLTCLFDFEVRKDSDGSKLTELPNCNFLDSADSAEKKLFSEIYSRTNTTLPRELRENPVSHLLSTDSDIFVSGFFNRNFFIQRWFSILQHLSLLSRPTRVELFCSQGTRVSQSCDEAITTLMTKLERSTIFSSSLQRIPDKHEPLRQTSALQFRAHYTQTSQEYYSTLAEFY